MGPQGQAPGPPQELPAKANDWTHLVQKERLLLVDEEISQERQEFANHILILTSQVAEKVCKASVVSLSVD
jgi:hypothetical protein